MDFTRPLHIGGGSNSGRSTKNHGLTDIQKQVGDALFADKRIPDPVGCVDANGKPVFDTTTPFMYAATEKEMDDGKKLAWRTYALWRTTLKVDRRDSVYEALTSGEYNNYSAAHHFLGTPFPVIEAQPHIFEAFIAIRWYEHILCALITMGSYSYVRTKPVLRYSNLNMMVQRSYFLFVFVYAEFAFGERAICRLQGKFNNEVECYKYGTIETKDRLEKKVEYWRKYSAFKAEWIRRWDYHVWGQRPGERYTLFSACMSPHMIPQYTEKTDFPMRKNPFIISTKRMSQFKLEPICCHWYPQHQSDPVLVDRPEFKYLYRPLSTSGWNV